MDLSVPECPMCGNPFPGQKTCPECECELVSRGKRLIFLALIVVIGIIVVGAMIILNGQANPS